ncbi:peroxiredoxin [Homoserinibacter sp. GY 40078]|uniref:peroxiredoxin n=1 Tax=Homoserinibacter sp. GY 40078 TaxID=2603275 RepID=UPI0011C907DD|nr:peroxiredoxin [Homoserinibacter sp. GY 40078]TXK19588.1 peroxiredoxin [Homoserinibacter sp. GY 40078]
MTGTDIGDIAPDFRLPGIRIRDGQTEHSEFALSAARGRPLVLAFYPLDASKVCTEQLCSYQDQLAGFRDLGAEVWGISPQGIESHEEFARAQGITFPLLADTAGVAREYGVMLAGLAVRRSVFILDGAGAIRWKHVAMVGLTYRSAEQIREELRRLFPTPDAAQTRYALPPPE